MSRVGTGRKLLTFVCLFWALGAVAADFNETHVFNPQWLPHARFHAAFQLLLTVCTALVALRLIWATTELLNGTLLICIYPAAFLLMPLVPGVAFSDPGQPEREMAGIPGQIWMAVITLALSALGYWLAKPRVAPSR